LRQAVPRIFPDPLLACPVAVAYSVRNVRAASRQRFRTMSLPSQSVALLQAARDLVKSLPADAVLLLTETSLDWDEVSRMLAGCKLFVAAENPALTTSLRE